MVINVAIAFNI